MKDVLRLSIVSEEAEKEHRELKEAGTMYRQESARAACDITKYLDPSIPLESYTHFKNFETTKAFVADFLENEDEERIHDVAKLLHTIVKDVRFKDSMSDECRAYVEEKRKDRTPLSFKEEEE